MAKDNLKSAGFGARIPHEINNRLKKMAISQKRSKAGMVVIMIEDWLRLHENHRFEGLTLLKEEEVDSVIKQEKSTKTTFLRLVP